MTDRHSNSDFRFLPANRFSGTAIWDTYKDFFSKGLSFWQSLSYDIRVEKSLLALAVFSAILFALNTGRFFHLTLFSLLMGVIGSISFTVFYVALLHFFRDWFRATGGFTQYLAFFAYGQFVFLPFALVAVALPILGRLATLGASLWVLYCFCKTFQVSIARFFLLIFILIATIGLGLSALVWMGMRLFS